MRSKQPFSAGKPTFVIFMALLLALMIVAAPAQARKFKVLHTFHGAPADGAIPWTQLTRDAAGNLYGTTEEGGNGKGICVSFAGCGTAFKLDKTGKVLWLHSFKGGNGLVPMAGLLRTKSGNLYGTTLLGGDTRCFQDGCGTVFKLDKTGKETVLYKFADSNDGFDSQAFLVEDAAGNLYGTTVNGGTGGFGNGGTVFRVDSAGRKTLLYSFCLVMSCADGNDPSAGVILDAAGNVYGVTGGGGAYGKGTVFELDTNGEETVLYSFTGGSDGAGPSSVLLADSAGNLYGTTQGGGSYQGQCGGLGCGVVFELSPHAGGSWTEATLYTFNGSDGERPFSGPLIMDSGGNLYGTTAFGGASRCNGSGCGVVFKLDTGGKETVLHNFTGGADGWDPVAGLARDKAGNLYGTTLIGGDRNCAIGNGAGCGVVFKIIP